MQEANNASSSNESDRLELLHPAIEETDAEIHLRIAGNPHGTYTHAEKPLSDKLEELKDRARDPNQSIPKMLSDFAQAYNRLHPTEPILSNQVIEHFTEIANPELNAQWNKPEALLKFLSDAYQQEKRSVELIQSREIRAAQDTEYEEMMSSNLDSSSASSPLPLTHQSLAEESA